MSEEQKAYLPAELKEKVEKSGLVLNRAERIAAGYAPFLADLKIEADKLRGLDKSNPDHAEIAKRVRIDIGKICSLNSKQKKADKQKILIAQRFIDGLYNTVEGFGRLTQGEAEDIENHFINIEKEKVAKISEERESEMVKYLTGDEDSRLMYAQSMKLGEMPKDVYDVLIHGYKQQAEMRLEADRKAEEARLAAEKKAQVTQQRKELVLPLSNYQKPDDIDYPSVSDDEFDKYMAGLQKRKKESDAENERVKQQQIQQEAELKKEAEEKAKLEEELAKSKEEAKAKEALLRKELADAELAKKQALEEKAKIDAQIKAEEDRKANEADLKAEEEKRAAEAPDKEKIIAWIRGFQLSDPPVSNQVTESINEKFTGFSVWAEKLANK